MLVWSIATPLMTGPDEASHVERAAAVARGQATGRREQGVAPYWLQIDVPTGLAAAPEAGNCFRGPFVAQLPGAASRQPTFPLAPSSCPRLARQGGRVVVRTVEYRGQPSYYVAVGWISLLAPDATGAYLMRALTALVCAAFVASALASTRRLAWPRLAALGVFAAMPPTAIYLAGMVNTNGLEIAAAVSLWATGLALVRAEDGPSPRLVRRAGLAFCTLVLLRGFSPFFALGAVAVLCWLAGAEPGRRAAIWQAARAWVVAAIVALAASCAWLLWITTSYPLLAPPGSGLAQSVRQTPVIVRQAVGLFGNSTSALPMWAIAAWVIAVGLLVGIALSRGRRRDAAVVGSLAVATFLFNIAADGLGFPPSGYVWQGRYGLPLLVGVVVLGTGMARPTAETDGRLARAIGARGPPV
ncbi:MAG: putative rane protein, partial [Acidimicrobiales bacterium]|nr:putative rane protein [Acidimicrobiales bacterium]